MFITLVIIPAFVTFLAFHEPKSKVDNLMHETMAGKVSCGSLSECCLFFHTVKQL